MTASRIRVLGELGLREVTRIISGGLIGVLWRDGIVWILTLLLIETANIINNACLSTTQPLCNLNLLLFPTHFMPICCSLLGMACRFKLPGGAAAEILIHCVTVAFGNLGTGPVVSRRPRLSTLVIHYHDIGASYSL